jgi:hypothetical protein
MRDEPPQVGRRVTHKIYSVKHQCTFVWTGTIVLVTRRKISVVYDDGVTFTATMKPGVEVGPGCLGIDWIVHPWVKYRTDRPGVL